MTAPKRWPKRAESARIDSLAAARDIQSHGQEAKRAIGSGNRDLALYLVSEMQLAAREIEMAMRLVKIGTAD